MEDIKLYELAELKLLLGGVVYVNTEDEHYKYWHINVIGESYETSYGRIGKRMNKAKRTCTTHSAAKREAQKKITEKLRKGYVAK